jgi:predicted RNA polymerase sigma factor
VPDHHELPERLGAVLDVAVLVDNEGYTPATADPVRDVLRHEAIELAMLLSAHPPDEPEALGCCALLLAHEARAGARVDPDGELVSLEQQDRRSWNGALVAEADRVLQRALRQGRPGPLQYQAAISALHSSSPRADDTDWHQIVVLYDGWMSLAPSPTTSIGRAVAVGMADGPQAGPAAFPPPTRRSTSSTAGMPHAPTSCAVPGTAMAPASRSSGRRRWRRTLPSADGSVAKLVDSTTRPDLLAFARRRTAARNRVPEPSRARRRR